MEFLTSEELAKRWKMPIGTIWSMSSKKQLPAVRFGKRIVRYRLSDILAFEQDRSQKVSA